ncbi:MBL fold metallo-hydrolase [Nereida sp. MMG025]|uniref:MBL fold metallo-hydrolase n=1 Tax=Nereida sp. MMG025 TaxID=2909981 RepID=UPI001F32E9DB|nr:MBL fold metallo-hydrolase [Nereida sp. MMG025]MCF6443673.1 MBL fold metallo-hydrolase [Nereida sp. MMG025]
MISRRTLLQHTGAFVATCAAGRAFAQTQVQLGAATLHSISDGSLSLPGDMFFAALPQDELAPILQAANVSRDAVSPPCNLTLYQTPDATILFDAGSGSGFMPSAGMMQDSLDAIGVAVDDITHVVFTHAHPDHLWGVLDDFDDPMFPNASYMISQVEWDYWTNPETVDSIGADRASFAVGAARRLEAIADTITFFKDGDEVFSGVQAIATHGHTPGHTSFELRSGTSAVLVGGDAIGNHHVALARPAWASGSDQNPELGASTRQALLDRLVADDIALLGFHLPQGGLGRIERQDSGYRFIAGEM